MLHHLSLLAAQAKVCFPQRLPIALAGAMHVVRAQCRFTEWTMGSQELPSKDPKGPKLESGPEQAFISMLLCYA